jgi:hypothetical protein
MNRIKKKITRLANIGKQKQKMLEQKKLHNQAFSTLEH